MARIARVVASGGYHHVSQWGNRAQDVFFNDSDRQYYLDRLKAVSATYGLRVFAYCLMDNHVHLIVVPSTHNSLSCGIGKVHREYTQMVNARQGWRGYLWQGRFMSYPFEQKYLPQVARYVERAPVRRSVVKKAEDYAWSSAARRSKGCDPYCENILVEMDWFQFLSCGDKPEDVSLFKQHSMTGRPLGGQDFIKKVSALIGRDLRKKKPGPKA